MSDDDFAGFAPPPFKPEAALEQLRRGLRDLKLRERGPGFELKGLIAIEWELQDGALLCRLARRLRRAGTPDWDRFLLKSGADQRKLLDEVKKRLARWEDDE